jgi:hypothetical protein
MPGETVNRGFVGGMGSETSRFVESWIPDTPVMMTQSDRTRLVQASFGSDSELFSRRRGAYFSESKSASFQELALALLLRRRRN